MMDVDTRTDRSRLAPWMACLLVLATACSDDDGSFDRRQMLRDTADDVVMPLHERLADRAGALDAAADDFCQNPTEESLEDARSAWREAKDPLKHAESWAFGPYRKFGLAVHKNVDKWPAFPDEIEAALEELEDEDDAVAYVDGQDYTRHAKGLPAVGYLLWADGSAESTLGAFTDEGSRPEQRCRYLTALTTRSREILEDVADEWSPDGGGYLEEFAEPGPDSDAFGTEQAAIDKMVNTMVYVSEMLAEQMKLGEPLGHESGGEPQPDSVEARFSETSREDLLASLEGIEMAYAGPDGKSLGDYTRFRKPAVDDNVRSALEEAREAIEAIEAPLHVAVEQHTDQVEEAHGAVADLSRTLKSELRTILGVTKTNIVADND